MDVNKYCKFQKNLTLQGEDSFLVGVAVLHFNPQKITTHGDSESKLQVVKGACHKFKEC